MLPRGLLSAVEFPVTSKYVESGASAHFYQKNWFAES
jgi:hypothetical protein